ncbi:MAG: AarF/ABC1/UbiB kinase family protein [Myxococcales bacterium]|nr:AarF/ABC1/UbiB kinase family protein [Myxococcales bacterium]
MTNEHDETSQASEKKQSTEGETRTNEGVSSVQDPPEAEKLEEINSIPTSRFGRFLKAGWVARHAIPLALRRTVELGAPKDEAAEEIHEETEKERIAREKLLKQQEAVAEELFRTLGTLKGVAQKVGQMLSYLEGVLPAELAPVYQKALSRLQASAPALPPDASQSMIESELDCLLEDHFAVFEPVPFAAASVGQVHRARLHDGTKVIVKVQYPDVDRAFESDLKNLKLFETMLSPLIRYYNAKDLLDQARQQLLDELDYQREAQAQQRFFDLFQGHPHIKIPRVFEHLSARRILVTEYVEGMTFEEMRTLEQPIRDRAAVTLFRYYWESLFIHNYVNADPHPGNYIFHEDGSVTFLDFGASVDVNAHFIRSFQHNITAHIQKDEERFRETTANTYGFPTQDPVVFEAYLAAIKKFLEPLTPEHQPFRFSTRWIESFLEDGLSQSRQILTRGGKIPRLPPPGFIPPDLPVLQRIGLGLSSLIARLHGSNDWANEALDIFSIALEQRPDPL